jgi:hypothetical protein
MWIAIEAAIPAKSFSSTGLNLTLYCNDKRGCLRYMWSVKSTRMAAITVIRSLIVFLLEVF